MPEEPLTTAEPRPSVTPRVTAIVPAYNEAATLSGALAPLRTSPLVHEVVVVSDGSTDDTLAVARALGVRAVALENNHGKGHAMAVGVESTSAPILAFVDGDILNLTTSHLDQLIRPVLDGDAAMNIGARSRGILNPLQRRFGPFLSGIRCLEREIFLAVPEDYLSGYRVEVALNWACRRLGRKLTCTVLRNLEHRVKEQKQGLWLGLGARARMFGTVLAAYLRLKLDPPETRGAAPVRRVTRG